MKRAVMILAVGGLVGSLFLCSTTSTTNAKAPEMQHIDGDWVQSVNVERILRKCTTCHGKALTGKKKKTKKTPAIAGLPKSKIMKTLTRKIPKPMKAVAKALTREEKTAIAKHISALPNTGR